jgi:hypothetical protein
MTPDLTDEQIVTLTSELIKKGDALEAAVARVPYVLTDKTARIEVELRVWLGVVAAMRTWRAARERRE